MDILVFDRISAGPGIDIRNKGKRLLFASECAHPEFVVGFFEDPFRRYFGVFGTKPAPARFHLLPVHGSHDLYAPSVDMTVRTVIITPGFVQLGNFGIFIDLNLLRRKKQAKQAAENECEQRFIHVLERLIRAKRGERVLEIRRKITSLQADPGRLYVKLKA